MQIGLVRGFLCGRQKKGCVPCLGETHKLEVFRIARRAWQCFALACQFAWHTCGGSEWFCVCLGSFALSYVMLPECNGRFKPGQSFRLSTTPKIRPSSVPVMAGHSRYPRTHGEGAMTAHCCDEGSDAMEINVVREYHAALFLCCDSPCKVLELRFP